LWIAWPKAVTLAGVLHRLVQRAAGDAGGGGRDGRAALVEDLHADHEAVAFAGQQVLRRHFHVLEEDLAGLGRVLAELLQRLAGADAGPTALDDEAAHPAVAGAGVGLGKDGEIAGHRPVGDPGLGAVEDEGVTLAHRGGLDAGHIGAGVRLGHAVGHDLAAFGEAREVLLLLRIAAGDEHGQRRQLVEHQRRLDAGAAVGQLFADDALFEHIGAHAAVFFRDVQVDQARPAPFSRLATAIRRCGRNALPGE
jgi:hypothetical protein